MEDRDGSSTHAYSDNATPTHPLPATKFSLSLSQTNRKHGHGQLQQRPAKRRRTSLLGNIEDDPDYQQPQQISSFGKDSVSDELPVHNQTHNTRVIKSIPDKDWREESRRKGQGRSNVNARVVQQNPKGGEVEHEDTTASSFQGPMPKFGLTVVHKTQNGAKSQDGTAVTAMRHLDAVGAESSLNEETSPQSQPQTADEEALAALLGQNRSVQDNIIAPVPPSEDEVFRDSYASAPRNCTLEEYEATPVEGYGAAILRGYLKAGQTLEDRYPVEGQNMGGSGSVPERRPGLLGLGAKESGLGVELGAWGKGTTSGKGRGSNSVESSYNPLARRNKKTGEMVTEDVLREKLDAQRVTPTDSGSREGKKYISYSHDERHTNASRTYASSREQRDNKDYSRSHRKDRDRVHEDTSHRYRRRENDVDALERRRRNRDEELDYNNIDADRRRQRKEASKEYQDLPGHQQKGRIRETSKSDHYSIRRY